MKLKVKIKAVFGALVAGLLLLAASLGGTALLQVSSFHRLCDDLHVL